MAQGQCVQIVGTGCLTAQRPRCELGARIRHYVGSFVKGFTNDMIVAMLRISQGELCAFNETFRGSDALNVAYPGAELPQGSCSLPAYS
jgi:hypothetical protein